jgi:hypothetical protein
VPFRPVLFLGVKSHVGSSSYVNTDIIRDYRRDVFIPNIENCRVIRRKLDSPIALLMNNCSAHLRADLIEMLSSHNIKITTFPLYRSAIFQMLDRVFFGLFLGRLRQAHASYL